MQARVRFDLCPRNPLRRSCVSSARNAGESAIGSVRAQPSAEIARVVCAKECDLICARATLCGDRGCRAREMQARVRFDLFPRNPLRRSGVSCQARVRFGLCPRNPLRRSCASSARKAGESAIWPAKCGRECEWCDARAALCGDRACRVHEMRARVRCVLYTRATPCGDRARRVRETQARVRFDRYPRNPLRRSCVSSARNTGENASGSTRGEPAAEIVRVECAKCRRECDVS